jgi:uncharacterized membrane protein
MDEWMEDWLDGWMDNFLTNKVPSTLSPNSGFNPRPFHLGALLVIVALGQFFLTILRVSLFSVSPPVLCAHLSSFSYLENVIK